MPPPRQAGGLRRVLSAGDLILLGIGVILGTGVFVVTGQAAALHAGPAVTLCFVLAGLAAGLAALCYAELAAMMPVAGSAYVYVGAALGELPGFLVGWTLALEWLVSGGLVAVGWSGYAQVLVQHTLEWTVPAAWGSAPWAWDEAAGRLGTTGSVCNLPAVAIVATVTAVLVRGVTTSTRINRLLVAVKVLVIAAFLGAAIKHGQPAHWRPFLPANDGRFGHFGLSGLMQGTTLVYLSFIGFDAVSTAAGEARRPQRDVPLGTLVPVAVCCAIYIAVALGLTALVPIGQLGVPHPLAHALEVHGLGGLSMLVSMGATLGLCSCLMGTLWAQPRIFMAMSQDGLLPRALGQVAPGSQVPERATWLCGAVAMLLAGFVPLEVLGEMASVGTLLIFAWVAVAVMVLRVRQPHRPRRFAVPGGRWLVPLAAVGTSLTFILAARPATLCRLAIYLGVGLGIFLLTWRARAAHGAAAAGA